MQMVSTEGVDMEEDMVTVTEGDTVTGEDGDMEGEGDGDGEEEDIGNEMSISTTMLKKITSSFLYLSL